MNSSKRIRRTAFSGVVLMWVSWAPVQWAGAHNGGIIVQLQNGKLVTGLDNEQPGGSPNMNERVFSSLFRPSLYGQDLPSFLSLASPPAGTSALPSGANIYWDFMPMTIDGVTSNLFYWDGEGTTTQDVQFGLVPQADVTMGLYNVTDNSSAIIDGSPDMADGALLGITDTTGSGLRLHRHNWFLLDDGDGGIPPTVVPEGVYLIAMQLDTSGFSTSDPFFIVAGTYELISTSLESLDAAVQWVRQNSELLILDGDYDFDGDVDAADYITWQEQFGSSGQFPINGDYADGNRDTHVDAADYVIWRKNLGGGAAAGVGLAVSSADTIGVPEPASLILFSAAAALGMLCRRKPQ